MNAEFPQSLVDDLKEGWVTRQQILKLLGLGERGAREAVEREALHQGLVPLRCDKGKQFVVSYHLREPRGDDQPGKLIEVADVGVRDRPA